MVVMVVMRVRIGIGIGGIEVKGFRTLLLFVYRCFADGRMDGWRLFMVGECGFGGDVRADGYCEGLVGYRRGR